MRILKNHVIKEWFSLFLLSLIVISFVLVMGNIIKLVELIITKGVEGFVVLKLFLYLLPSLLVFSIPISILSASLLSFGRMAYENEITAIRASGISLYPFLFVLLLIGILFSLTCLYFNDSLIPQAHYRMRTTLQEIGIKKPTAYLEEKTFIKAFKDYIIFIYRIQGDYLEDVRIYQPQTGKPTRTIIAEKGEFISIPEKNAIKLVLKNGSADEPSFDDPEFFYKLNFKNYNFTLNLQNNRGIEQLNKKIADMTIREIEREIEVMRMLKIDERPLLVGLYRKFSLSFSSLIFVLIGMPLAIRIKRRERSFGVALSLIICLFYYLFMALGESLALRNKLSPVIGAWLPNIFFLIIGLILSIKVLEE
ncbi:MAG: LptF/LptG family permease [Candidatus Omnitrophica bacterium]|nr:LptF/LptG family permease [Candidatus Omnitrophota bacterium]MBU4478124.1 LptF/LptG family permease [Candidatus Omnitrophota bacterium]MCG2704043.1 LptF/LptG family permease [Candidatus Omnitrophota bacterium]